MAKTANVSLTKKVIDSVATVSEVLDLPQIQSRWVKMQNEMFGMSLAEANMRFETEKVLFSQAISSNAAFSKCDKFSVYAAFMQLCISGLTLREGLTYVIPNGTKVRFDIGWKGRLEQLKEMRDIEDVYTPEVVYDCDTFEYTKGMQGLEIHKHEEPLQRPANAKITHVYVIIEKANGKTKAYMMNRQQVLNIRDTRSKPYISYMKWLSADVNKGKNVGDTIKAQGSNGYYDLEPPMWVTDEEQAFKKTLVKRVYTEMPNKLNRHKSLDTLIESQEYESDIPFDGIAVDEDEPITPHEEVSEEDECSPDEPENDQPEPPKTEKKGKGNKQEGKQLNIDDYSDGEAF